MQRGLRASAWSSVDRGEQPALHAVPEGAAASMADGIAPGSRALLFLVLSGTALAILGARLSFHISFWDKSKKGH